MIDLPDILGLLLPGLGVCVGLGTVLVHAVGLPVEDNTTTRRDQQRTYTVVRAGRPAATPTRRFVC